MTNLPDTLRSAIEQDLRPVRPLAAPAVRVWWMVPFAVLLLLLSAAAFGLRVDAPAVGPALTWGASVVQMCAGIFVMWAALRESVPGTTLSRRFAGTIFGTVLVVLIGITWITWLASPTTIRPEAVLHVWRICVAGPLLMALPAFAVAGLLVTRAFPLRPPLAGALYGLGVGLMSDAGWRLFCHFSDPVHVLGAHTLAVGLLCAAGSLAAHIASRQPAG